jgi:hypothetical protein
MAKVPRARRPMLDPMVADLLSGMEQKQAEAQLPRREREKKVRERAKIQARRDQRATYDLPPGLRTRIKELAEEERLPASQLVTLALIRFLSDLEAGEWTCLTLNIPRGHHAMTGTWCCRKNGLERRGRKKWVVIVGRGQSVLEVHHPKWGTP